MRDLRFRARDLIVAALLLAAPLHAQEALTASRAPGRIPNQLSRPSQQPAASGQTEQATAPGYAYSVLYSFCLAAGDCLDDGYAPAAGLFQDGAGNLYGTTTIGGPALEGGSVFKLDTSNHEKLLLDFCSTSSCTEGKSPMAGLIQDSDGNFYGTTELGGTGSGTVFKLGTSGHVTVLYSFCPAGAPCPDGETPLGGLVQDSAGNLYGTASAGGAHGDGAVFKISSAGGYSVLYSFCSVSSPTATCADGSSPKAGLVLDAAGNLYGTTEYGGVTNPAGTIFKVSASGVETVLYNFCSATGCTDGYQPDAALYRDAAGNLYGTTSQGGAGQYANSSDSLFGGTVFRLDNKNNYTVLYNFCSASNCTDGSNSVAGLVQDPEGNLYGTTPAGGANEEGVVFKLDTSNNQTVLYSFCSVSGCADGSQPEAGLILDTAGNLYGTTYRGGFENYDGVVFKLTAPPVGTQTQTITFPNPGPLTYGVGSVPLIATASSGLPVYFVILSASPVNVATVTGDTLTVNDAGSVAVQAAQSGNATYAAAAPVTDPITVLPAPLTVVCDNTAVNYGWPIPTTLPVTLTGLVPGDGITATCTTTATQGSPAGPYSIIPTLIDPNGRLSNYSVSSANGTLTIGKQAASIPLILSLSQSTAAAESPGFTLTVTGANFASNAVLLWNGAARKTTPGSSTQLTATVLASDIQNAGTSLVTVINPAPNAGVSAAQPFAVQSSAPTITAASLADTPAAGGDRLLTLTGTNFTPQSTVELKGSTTLASMYLNSWTITALVTPSDYTLLPIVLTVANSSVTSSGFELQ